MFDKRGMSKVLIGILSVVGFIVILAVIFIIYAVVSVSDFDLEVDDCRMLPAENYEQFVDRFYCFVDAAYEYAELDDCEKLDLGVERSSCFSGVAEKGYNYTICDKAGEEKFFGINLTTHPTYSEQCLLRVAISFNHLLGCSNINNSETKNACEQIILNR